MKISYYKVNPTGNITLIVETPVKRESQAAVAAKLMELDKTVEQVGFIEKPRRSSPIRKVRYLNASEEEFKNTPGEYEAIARLQMMGGEFCGNASISAAAILVSRSFIREGDGYEMLLEVSGIDEDISVTVECNTDGSFTGTVDMPIPEAIYDYTFINGFDTYTFPLVRFPGICHVIINHPFSPLLAEKLIADWCRQLRAEALGLLFLEERSKKLEPLVYVASTGTTVWENSCASGTCAAAAYFAKRKAKSTSASLIQPGGTLKSEASFSSGAVRSIKLTGRAVIEGYFEEDIST